MPNIYQIDAKPYTVWNLSPNGWTIIQSFITDKYIFKTMQTIQLKEAYKFDFVKNEIII
jgi:hypothetical protein